MKRRFRGVLTITAMICLGLNITAQAQKTYRKNHNKNTNHPGRLRLRAKAYAVPLEAPSRGGGSVEHRAPLAATGFSDGMASPGVVVGYTYYDWQQNSAMGRQIETGPHSGESGYAIVHMGWTYVDDWHNFPTYRSYAYSAYLSENQSFAGPVYLTEGVDTTGGYVNVRVTPDNRAVVAGHISSVGHVAPLIYYDGGPGYATFPVVESIPDSVVSFAQVSSDLSCWPKFGFQVGTDTVLHVVAQIAEQSLSTSQSLLYYRKAGFEGSSNSEWDYPPYVIDTIQSISHVIESQHLTDRVAIAWTANLPYDEPWCDTCSGLSVYDGTIMGTMDNDVYYQESFDQGLNWQPRVNLTRCLPGEAAYKPYADVSILFDTDGNLHLIWPACPWPADPCWNTGGSCFSEEWYRENARLFHWSENVPYIRPIADQVYEMQAQLLDSCLPGAWSLRIAKPSLSECEDKLFVLWTQFNDPRNGIIDDCAEWGYEFPALMGAANGELFMSTSSDLGMTWDYPRNLTNSYTPRCDPQFGDECQSDNWASMPAYGRAAEAGEDWSGAYVLDPSGGTYVGNYYLDVMYINDLDAGGVPSDEGSWTNNPVKWFRIPCVDPVPCPVLETSPTEISYPTFVKPGESLDTALTLTNSGNTELTYVMTIIEDNGTPGWLQVSGFSGSIPAGLYGYEVGTITLNANHMTQMGNYFGRLHIESNACEPPDPVDIEIVFTIVDTVAVPTWDTISTQCMALTVSSHGNLGNEGLGKVNMDFYPGDCDSTAKVYLYDGSPIVLGVFDDDTLINSAFWGLGPQNGDIGFEPMGEEIATKICGTVNAQVYHTGSFYARSFPLRLRKIYFAPQDDCNFIIQYTMVETVDDVQHENIVLGEAIDWDVPWDYRSDDPFCIYGFINSGGVDVSRNLVYQQGYDAHGAGSDTLYPFNCQYNDNRFAGMAFIQSYFNGSQRASVPYGGFVGENDSLLSYYGFVAEKLYPEMMVAGLRGTDSLEDLHSVMCYENAIDIGPNDVYEVITALATIENGTLADLQAAIDEAVAWYNNLGQSCLIKDNNGDGQTDLCVACCVTMGKFYQDGQPFNILDIDNFIEWLLRNPGDPDPYDCFLETDVSSESPGVRDCRVDILDLDYMIGYLLRDEYLTLGECP